MIFERGGERRGGILDEPFFSNEFFRARRNFFLFFFLFFATDLIRIESTRITLFPSNLISSNSRPNFTTRVLQLQEEKRVSVQTGVISPGTD